MFQKIPLFVNLLEEAVLRYDVTVRPEYEDT